MQNIDCFFLFFVFFTVLLKKKEKKLFLVDFSSLNGEYVNEYLIGASVNTQIL